MAEFTMTFDAPRHHFMEDCREYERLELFYWKHPLQQPKSYTSPSVKPGALDSSITHQEDERPTLGGEWLD